VITAQIHEFLFVVVGGSIAVGDALVSVSTGLQEIDVELDTPVTGPEMCEQIRASADPFASLIRCSHFGVFELRTGLTLFPAVGAEIVTDRTAANNITRAFETNGVDHGGGLTGKAGHGTSLVFPANRTR
jgi:hypothetical protein